MPKLGRFVVGVALLAGLAACGFSPIYGVSGRGDIPVQTALNNVAISNINGENGQFLRNKLIDRMYTQGRPTAPQARLAVDIHSSEAGLGIKKDATASRSQLTLTATYTLSGNDGKTLVKGTARSVASYSKLDAQYGTVATQRDAYHRALIEVSEQIVNKLSLYYAEKAPKPATQAAARP